MAADTDPLTDLEYEAVVSAMRSVFANGRFSTSGYTLMTLAVYSHMKTFRLEICKHARGTAENCCGTHRGVMVVSSRP